MNTLATLTAILLAFEFSFILIHRRDDDRIIQAGLTTNSIVAISLCAIFKTNTGKSFATLTYRIKSIYKRICYHCQFDISIAIAFIYIEIRRINQVTFNNIYVLSIQFNRHSIFLFIKFFCKSTRLNFTKKFSKQSVTAYYIFFCISISNFSSIFFKLIQQ